jgi:hypothetical protein
MRMRSNAARLSRKVISSAAPATRYSHALSFKRARA